MKLFISYSSRDRETVKSLAQDLEAAVKTLPKEQGVEFGVWFDQELIGGHDWWDNILSAVYHCDLFIFALTPSSLASGPCKLEYTFAHDLNKRILPVLLSSEVNAALLPTPLQRIQFVDYRQQDKAAYQHLLEAMANLPPAQPLPDPLPAQPPAPVSPLAELKEKIEAPSLDLDTQLKLVHQLKQYLHEPDKASGARQLLGQLQSHPDIRASVAQDITLLLQDVPPPVTKQPPPQPEPQFFPTPAPAFRTTTMDMPKAKGSGSRAAWIGVAIGLLVALVLSTQYMNLPGGVDYFGNYYTYTDYEMVGGLFVVCPIVGWVAGKLYARYVKPS
jgi:hypothetical protein